MQIRFIREPKSLAAVALLILSLGACRSQPTVGTEDYVTSAEMRAVQAVVDRYIASVNAADTEMARQVWAEREDISFIHPLGHEEGWAQIKANIYEKLMGGMFSARRLTIKRITTKLHGESAVVEFYWEFDASWRKDGSALKTQGRETQVLLKDRKGAWRLAHVHYSGMPTGNTSQGF